MELRFDRLVKTIFNEYQLLDVNKHFIVMEEKLPGFVYTYKYLINENYNIFPVPKKFIDDMLEFCLNNSRK